MNKWISIREKAPKKGQGVLVFINPTPHEEPEIGNNGWIVEAQYGSPTHDKLYKIKALLDDEEKKEVSLQYDWRQWVYAIPFVEMDRNKDIFLSGNITHWMPIPEHPIKNN